MLLKKIKLNSKNPRLIKDRRFKKLVQSLKEFPKMLALRPIVINEDNIVLGGNMRLKALRELGYKEVPDAWVKRANELTEEEKKRFVITDNIEFGENDFDILANEWDETELMDLGMELPVFDDVDFDNIKSNEDRKLNENIKEVTCPKCGHKFKQ